MFRELTAGVRRLFHIICNNFSVQINKTNKESRDRKLVAGREIIYHS